MNAKPLLITALIGAAVPLLKSGIKTLGKGAAGSDLNPLGSPNLMAFTKQARVEPIVLIDQRLNAEPELGNVMQGLLSFFAATYLQAVSLSLPVGKVNPRKTLDSLNPDRSVMQAGKGFFSRMYSTASLHTADDFKYGLPSMEQGRFFDQFKRQAQHDDTPLGQRNSADKLNDMMSKNANLSVGRILDVEVDDGTSKRTIPIQFRLISTLVPANVLTHILGAGSRDLSARETWHDWRQRGGGWTGFWRDVVMADQLVKEHRKTLINDTSGTYQEILERRKGNLTASVLSGTPSLATAANMLVLSQQSAKELEAKSGYKLNNFASRQRIFDSTYVMILVVMDPAWNRVTYYHSGIKLPTAMSFNELKSATKGSGIDVEQVLKAMLLGNQVPV